MAVQLVVAGTAARKDLCYRKAIAGRRAQVECGCPALIVWDAAEPKEKSKAFPLSDGKNCLARYIRIKV